MLLVCITDNRPRVRDGYISSYTRRHARARPTLSEALTCRENVIASARQCPLFAPLNLHGKEGVDGSSPPEGFKSRQKQGLRCLIWSQEPLLCKEGSVIVRPRDRHASGHAPRARRLS
jgi:hypothetical protein